MNEDTYSERRRGRKLLGTLAVIGLAASLIAVGAFSAFSATTTNPNNTFSAGSVTIEDNDAGSALYQVSNQGPGDVTDSCIQVTYTGSLDADVKLYASSAIDADGQYVDLEITPGTQASPTFPDCTGFVPDAGGAIYSGTLSAFGTSHSGWANGLVTNPPAATLWAQNDAVVYRFRVQVQDVNAAQGATVSAHDYTWEARNQ